MKNAIFSAMVGLLLTASPVRAQVPPSYLASMYFISPSQMPIYLPPNQGFTSPCMTPSFPALVPGGAWVGVQSTQTGVLTLKRYLDSKCSVEVLPTGEQNNISMASPGNTYSLIYVDLVPFQSFQVSVTNTSGVRRTFPIVTSPTFPLGHNRSVL